MNKDVDIDAIIMINLMVLRKKIINKYHIIMVTLTSSIASILC